MPRSQQKPRAAAAVLLTSTASPCCLDPRSVALLYVPRVNVANETATHNIHAAKIDAPATCCLALAKALGSVSLGAAAFAAFAAAACSFALSAAASSLRRASASSNLDLFPEGFAGEGAEEVKTGGGRRSRVLFLLPVDVSLMVAERCCD